MDNNDKQKELAGKMKKRLFFDMDNVLGCNLLNKD